MSKPSTIIAPYTTIIKVYRGNGPCWGCYRFINKLVPTFTTLIKLTEYTTHNTPAFKAWFGGSKVVDKNGDPLVVYHGTSAEFTVFKPWQHFGTKEQAQYRLNMVAAGGGKILAAYLRIEKPLLLEDVGDFDSSGEVSAAIEYRIPKLSGLHDAVISVVDSSPPHFSSEEAEGNGFALIETELRDRGYDGIKYDNAEEGAGYSYIAFSPNQIKSATDNSGAFSKQSDDMYK